VKDVAVPGTPLVKGRVRETALATQVLDGYPRFRLLEEADDLFFAESALLHVRHSPMFDGLSASDWYG
jgi:hypothetical protein